MTRKPRKPRKLSPTGVTEIDSLQDKEICEIGDYITGVSAYVRKSGDLSAGEKKSAQIRLSNALGRALMTDLQKLVPSLKGTVGERLVSGALRSGRADVTEVHELDGLRLAVELKPVNLAVGRAIWNRFGDLRTFAVNLHLKFPFAVVGGVLVIPTYELAGTKEAKQAEQEEEVAEILATDTGAAAELDETGEPEPTASVAAQRKSTVHLIDRAIARLVRAGGRKTEADAAHLLEGIAVVVYDPDKSAMEAALPPPGSGLRWNEFIDALATAYKARFEN